MDVSGTSDMEILPTDQWLAAFCSHRWNSVETEFGAGNESRTRDLNLGKVALYQLSYSRVLAIQLSLAL